MALITRTNDRLKVELHPGQVAAYDSRARFTFVIAGTQSGKTSFMPVKLDQFIREGGPGDYLAVTATFDLFKLKFLPEMLGYFVNLFGWQYAASDRVIWRNEGPQKTRIILRSANAEGGLESATAKAAVIDECGQDDFSLQAWEAIQRRLSLSQGRVFAGTTPYNLGWLKTEVFDRWTRGDSDYRVIQFKSTMNPAFPRAEYKRMQGKLPAWKFAMFYDGEFSRPAGLIYSDFTDWHICEPFDIPPSWPRFLGVDFGANNTAKVFAALDPSSNTYYVIYDNLEGDKTTAQHAESVKKNPYYRPDISGWGGAPGETQQRMDWSAAGVYLREPPVADVEAGIDRVIELLKTKRLRVFSSCSGLKDEFGRYSRELDENGQPTERIKDKSKFHHLDALRYVSAGMVEAISPRNMIDFA